MDLIEGPGADDDAEALLREVVDQGLGDEARAHDEHRLIARRRHSIRIESLLRKQQEH